MKPHMIPPLPPFPPIDFDASSHSYTMLGHSLISVTSVVNSLKKPVDAEKVATRTAAKRNTTKEAVLAEWDAKRVAGAARGTTMHTYIQEALSGKPVEKEPDPFLALNSRIPEMDAFDRFLRHAQETLQLRFLRVEWVMGDLDLRIGGTCDAVAFSLATGKLHVIDWKTGEKFRTENSWDKLTAPFGDLPECELSLYSLQASLYRLLIERQMSDPEYARKVMGPAYIVHLRSDGTFQVHRANDERERLEKWLLGNPGGGVL